VRPIDLLPLPPVQNSSPADVTRAVSAARAAAVAWTARSFDERARDVLAIAKTIASRAPECAELLFQETGRCHAECLLSEVSSVVEAAKGHIAVAKRATQTEKIALSMLDFPGKSAVIEAVPRGVVAIIAPWNYPLGNFIKHLFPALLSGNAVVLKPSEHTPRTGMWLGRLCAEVVGSAVQVVVGDGAIGGALIDAGVDAVAFTGSVSTGRRVSARCGERLIPCTVELGGKDAAIVLADCDLERTIAGVAQWAFHNAGQNCAGIERVYVEAPVADAFVEGLARVASRLRVSSDPTGAAPSDLGPLQNARQLAIVEEHVGAALAAGAVLVAGGARVGEGYGYAPTVLDHCNATMQVVREETFGPVVAVVRVSSAEDAVQQARESAYGLNGSVWTRDLARGAQLARQLDTGVALVNNHAFTGVVPALPWTGTKETGPGVAQSSHAYAAYVRRRAVIVDKGSKPDPWWMPIDANAQQFASALIARGLGRFSATLELAGLLGKRVRAIRALVSSNVR
jgi:acyl-CoA reductase-like NAD-dependent aldehyde dehydrogenase